MIPLAHDMFRYLEYSSVCTCQRGEIFDRLSNYILVSRECAATQPTAYRMPETCLIANMICYVILMWMLLRLGCRACRVTSVLHYVSRCTLNTLALVTVRAIAQDNLLYVAGSLFFMAHTATCQAV